MIGRALLLKSDRELASGAESSAAEFKYAVPNSVGGASGYITLPLAEWQTLTW
jgi:hypothetical protein